MAKPAGHRSLTKIAHIIREPRLAGAEILVARLCREHLKAGVAADILATHPPADSAQSLIQSLRDDGITFIHPEKRLGRLERIRFLRSNLGEIDADISFAHTVLPSLFARLASLGTRRKIVTVLHAASPDYYGVMALAERALSPPQAIVGVSQQNIDWYQAQFGTNVSTEYIPNGVPTDMFRRLPSLREEARREILGAGSNRTIFLHAGRIASVKRQDISIEAFERMPAEKQKDSLLVFAGLTEDTAFERHIRVAAGRNSSIRFVGPQSDMSRLFAACDAILVPSDHEAHPLIAIEGLCTCAWLLLSDIPAHRFAQSYDGVSLFRDAGELTSLMTCLRARKFTRPVETFDIARTARRYETVAVRLSAI